MTGSLAAKRLTLELLKSLHLNWEQATVTSQLSQSLTNIELLIGPIKNLQFVHLSTVI